MLNVGVLIADLLPDEAARQIRRITAGRELRTFDDQLRHVDNPELPQIARVLPADTAFQAVRTAARLHFDVSDVLTVVANAVTLNARSPKAQERTLRDNPDRTRPAPDREAPGSLAPLPASSTISARQCCIRRVRVSLAGSGQLPAATFSPDPVAREACVRGLFICTYRKTMINGSALCAALAVMERD